MSGLLAFWSLWSALVGVYVGKAMIYAVAGQWVLFVMFAIFTVAVGVFWYLIWDHVAWWLA